ncbi:MAG: DUF3857 and transglutaminase domain-containing protein [Bacteroidetes bacterium]|nr:DUF3857 and transglutaminase domain-containing protein [Bacteroidota bacterium]
MKSKKALIVTLILFSLKLQAQKQIPAFGKIDKSEMEMKDCDFDKKAEAVVLFDVAEVYCELNLNNPYSPVKTVLERHVRIKILNTKGTDRANIRIRYLNERNVEDVKLTEAQTANLDASGNIVFTKVEKDAIYNKKVNNRFSEVIFTFPEVKAGSVIEYKYKDEATDLNAVDVWYFQRSIPVIYSSYTLDFPNELVISAVPQGSFRVNMNERQKSNRNIKTFSLENIPALRDEAYISCDEDYLEKLRPMMIAVDFPGQPRKSLVRNWLNVIKTLMEDDDFGVQLKKNIPRTSDLDALLADVKDAYRRMVIIHDYVRKNMQWDNTWGIWATDGVKAAWKNKKGTSGEINLILVNLLKDAGLEAHPVLVSTRENGRVNTSIAGYYQFDKVMAFVTINDKAYVLDATDKITPPNLIPYSVLNTEGLVIEKLETFQWGWTTLWNPDQLYNTTSIISGTITDKGEIEGTGDVTAEGYSRTVRMDDVKKGKPHFIDAWLNQSGTDVQVDNLEFANENVDSLPLVQHFSFKKKVNSSGDYNYFSGNLFSGFDKNPFIADERFSDIFFGANQKYTIVGNFIIPNNCQFDALPKNTRMIMPDTSIIFTRSCGTSDNVLSVRYTLEFKRPFYMVSDYDYFKEFYKKMYELMNEQFVYKKTN